MEKEQNQTEVKEATDEKEKNIESETSENSEKNTQEEPKEKTPEEKILELEDKLARTFAEMENQRRRFEKEKEDAYEYGGFALSLIHI